MPEARRFQESRMPGNPLVRFDEGRVGRTQVSPSLLLYRPKIWVSNCVATATRASSRPQAAIRTPRGLPSAGAGSTGGWARAAIANGSTPDRLLMMDLNIPRLRMPPHIRMSLRYGCCARWQSPGDPDRLVAGFSARQGRCGAGRTHGRPVRGFAFDFLGGRRCRRSDATVVRAYAMRGDL